jgi:hypothetical protein
MSHDNRRDTFRSCFTGQISDAFPGKKETNTAIANVDEAEVIKPAEEGEEVFERMPTPPKPMALFESDLQRLNPAPALQDIWGKWPGDESIEELLAALTP